MTAEIINNAPSSHFDENTWAPLINFFWNRYNKRYFDLLNLLMSHHDSGIRNNCGFLVATINCVLIETLEQYYSGTDQTQGQNHDPFFRFFQRSGKFGNVIQDRNDAGKFAGLVRSGLLHQSKTQKDSIINIKLGTPILDWIDTANKNRGFKLNRNKFHYEVIKQFHKLIEDLKIVEHKQLRQRFKVKLLTLI